MTYYCCSSPRTAATMDKHVEAGHRDSAIADHDLLGDKANVDHEEATHIGELTEEEKVSLILLQWARLLGTIQTFLRETESPEADGSLRSLRRNSNGKSIPSLCPSSCWST